MLCHALIRPLWHSEAHRALLTGMGLSDSGFPNVGCGRPLCVWGLSLVTLGLVLGVRAG